MGQLNAFADRLAIWLDSRMARGLNEKQAAMDTGILDVALTLSSEFLAKVGGVLILDILDNGVPAGCQVSLFILFACKHAKAYHRSLLTWSP